MGPMLSCVGVGESAVSPAAVRRKNGKKRRQRRLNVDAEGERGYNVYFKQKLETAFSCHWLHCFMIVIIGLANTHGSRLLQSLVP